MGHPDEASKPENLSETDLAGIISIDIEKEGFDPKEFAVWSKETFDQAINLYYQDLARSNHEDFVENVIMTKYFFIGEEHKQHIVIFAWTLNRDLNTDKELGDGERITCFGLFFSTMVPNTDGYTVEFEKIGLVSARLIRYEREAYAAFLSKHPELNRKIENIFHQFDLDILLLPSKNFTFLGFAKQTHIDTSSGEMDVIPFGCWPILIKKISGDGEPEKFEWFLFKDGVHLGGSQNEDFE
jgi:hypothetical protein